MAGETPALPGLLVALLIVVLCTAALEPSAFAASKRDRAVKAYNQAVQMRAAFNARRAKPHSFKDYAKLERAFDAVYRLDPGYPNTPKALLAEAQIDQQMGRRFGSRRYYESAAETYRFLIDQYPAATVSREALFTLAEVYRVDLSNPQQADKTYTEFLTKYPYAAGAAQAKLRLREMNRQLEASAAAEARKAEESNPAAPIATPARLITVSDVRYWEGSSYTRVVISMEDEAKFQAVRLGHPDRIVFDLPGTRLGSSLAGKAFPVGNGFLQQIRVAQYRPDISRVVLDLEKIHDYSVFTLPNPFRMIIDIHGTAPLQQARLAGPSTPAMEAGNAVDLAPAGSPVSKTATSQPLPSQPPASAAANPSADDRGGAETADGESPANPAGSTSSGTTATYAGSARDSEGSAAAQRVSPSAHTSAGSATLTRALGLKIARIVIDPGHGGHDTGTLGPDGAAEKDVVLDVALRLRKLVQQRMGSEVVMTRSDDTFIPLEERTAIANQRAADLFISIHANASHDPSARGIEVYYLNFTSDPNSLEVAARENATSQESVHQLQSLIKKIALSEKIQESADFAGQVDRGLEQATARNGNPDRGLKKAPFVVLIGANMPSILAEISFLSNPRDEHLLQQAQYRQQIAEGLYRGVARYVANLGTMQIAQRGAGKLPTRRVSSRTLAPAPPSGAAQGTGPQDF
ncbi:MAG TPA: N-acetylmuramoyl-L-alanine amidase [Terriglobia bacterium]|nr:N-acetylmuramoyl-L-alanine amidase [Terriglobia bacterium]